MSNTIHMETESVQATAQKLDQIVVDIQEDIQTLGSAIRTLDWQGGARDEFINDFTRLEKSFTDLAEQGALLGRRVRSEVDEWITAAGVFAAGSGATTLSPENKAVYDTRNSIQEAWDKMSFDERKKWIEDYYKQRCKELGMPETDFTVEDLRDPKDGDYRGVYNNGGIFGWFRSMKIDSDNVKGDDPFQVMETVGHETQHQYQHYLVDHPDKRPPDISEETIKSWKDNFTDYKRWQDGSEQYENQPIEADARKAGEQAANEYINRRAEVI